MASVDQLLPVGAAPVADEKAKDPEKGMRALSVVGPPTESQESASLMDRIEAFLPGNTRMKKWITVGLVLAIALVASVLGWRMYASKSKGPCPDGYVEVGPSSGRRLMDEKDCVKVANEKASTASKRPASQASVRNMYRTGRLQTAPNFEVQRRSSKVRSRLSTPGLNEAVRIPNTRSKLQNPEFEAFMNMSKRSTLQTLGKQVQRRPSNAQESMDMSSMSTLQTPNFKGNLKKVAADQPSHQGSRAFATNLDMNIMPKPIAPDFKAFLNKKGGRTPQADYIEGQRQSSNAQAVIPQHSLSTKAVVDRAAWTSQQFESIKANMQGDGMQKQVQLQNSFLDRQTNKVESQNLVFALKQEAASLNQELNNAIAQAQVSGHQLDAMQATSGVLAETTRNNEVALSNSWNLFKETLEMAKDRRRQLQTTNVLAENGKTNEDNIRQLSVMIDAMVQQANDDSEDRDKLVTDLTLVQDRNDLLAERINTNTAENDSRLEQLQETLGNVKATTKTLVDTVDQTAPGDMTKVKTALRGQKTVFQKLCLKSEQQRAELKTLNKDVDSLNYKHMEMAINWRIDRMTTREVKSTEQMQELIRNTAPKN